MEKQCASCGGKAAYVVTLAYEIGERGGRLMPYCESCRDDSRFVQVAIPVDIDDDCLRVVIESLYRHGWTNSDPEIASELLGTEIPEVPHEAS